MPKRDPCMKQACDIQVCLQGNNYNEDKCKKFFESLTKCCEKFWKNSVVCEGVPTESKKTPT